MFATSRIVHRTVRSVIVPAMLATVSLNAGAQSPAPLVGSHMPAISAEDVTGAETTLRFDSGDAILIGVTDRDHRAVLSRWFSQLTPDAAHPFTRYSVVALSGMIPSMMRGSIRNSFSKTSEIKYLLDWGGKVSDQLGGGELPLVFVVAPGGTVRMAARGEPDSARVQAARAALTVGAAKP